MKAVVMAGGEGSRLRPLTMGRPKPMVPIVNAPVMEHIFALLRRHGITEVVVTLQYMANAIQEYFGDGSDFGIIVERHHAKSAMATLTLYRVPNPLEYGVVILDKDDRVTRFLEKPSWGEVFSDTVNTGIYVLDPTIFRYVRPGVPVDWSNDVFPQLLRNGDPMFGFVAGGYWCDVGNITEYVRANSDMLNGVVNLEMPGEEVGN